MPKRNPPASTRIAVVAAEPAGKAIADVLDAHGLPAARFCDPSELLDAKSFSDGSPIVLQEDRTGASLAGLLESLNERYGQSPIVIVCADIERWRVRVILKAGAAGVVFEPQLESALVPSLQAVRAGQTVVPRSSWRQIDPPVLSVRERQTLGLVVMGYMNSEIARQLYLAESTVKSHLSSAFSKLGVRSRNEAINLILDPEQGLGTGILSLGVEPLEAAVHDGPASTSEIAAADAGDATLTIEAAVSP